MNQYERIVSYIYRYYQGEKGANVGYAKIEKRANSCRVSVQMRAVPVNNTPQVYLYRQQKDGIRTVYVAPMAVRGGNLLCRANSDAGALFQTGESIDDMDGIFISVEENIYFATSWTRDSFYLGNWGKSSAESEKAENTVVKEIKAAENTEEEETTNVEQEGEKLPEEEVQEKEALSGEVQEKEVQTEEIQEEKIQAEQIKTENVEQKAPESTITGEEAAQEEGLTAGQTDMQMQSICGVCPFKRRRYDYGKKILMSFPSMRPFEQGIAKACVRMELQDIGCLPIASWSLSGNRFLLHGYYSYRHLIFVQMADGQYMLGVPGIYSEKDKSNAIRFGFSKFQSIGAFGPKQGAFGYWLFSLPEGDSAELV